MNLRSIVDTSELKRQRYLRLTREVDLRPGDRIIELGCGAGTRSIAAWNHENAIVAQSHLPDALEGRVYYEPTDRGFEARLSSRIAELEERWREARERARADA